VKKENLYHNESMWKGAGPELFKRAEELCDRMTKAEVRLWEN